MNAMICKISLALVIVALCSGCSDQPAGTPDALDQQPINVRSTILGLDELEYQDPILREQLFRVDALARRIADPKSQHVEWHESWHGSQTSSAGKAWMDYHALWCLRSDQPNHLCTQHTERAVHCISLRATPQADNPQKVSGFSLSARWHPAGDGWGVRLSYEYSHTAAVTEKFGLFFYNKEFAPADSDIVLAIPGGGCRLTKRFGEREYVIAVPTNSGEKPRDSRPFLASAESLRDAGLAVLDELEPLIREQIKSGQAVRSVTDNGKFEERTVGGTDGGDPPRQEFFHPTFKSPLSAEYQLDEQQTREILDEMLAEVERRRHLLREHYQEMYDAAQQAFPLNECLNRGIEH